MVGERSGLGIRDRLWHGSPPSVRFSCATVAPGGHGDVSADERSPLDHEDAADRTSTGLPPVRRLPLGRLQCLGQDRDQRGDDLGRRFTGLAAARGEGLPLSGDKLQKYFVYTLADRLKFV